MAFKKKTEAKEAAPLGVGPEKDAPVKAGQRVDAEAAVTCPVDGYRYLTDTCPTCPVCGNLPTVSAR